MAGSYPTDAPVAQEGYLWRQYSLLTDGWLLYQLLPKDNPLVAPLETLLDNGSRLSDDGACHHKPLVIEVGHDDNEALVLFAQQVVYWYLHIVELYECGAGSGGVARLDQLGLDGLVTLDEQDGEALVRLAACDEVVAEQSVRDPLLCASYDVVLAVWRQGCSSPDSGDV